MSLSVPLLKTLLPALLPDLAQWMHDQEATITAAGRSLTVEEQFDATAARVAEPSRIRLLVVESVPRPVSGILATANRTLEIVTTETRAFAFRYGIAVRSDAVSDRELLLRTYARVAQFEHFGGIAQFLNAFLIQRLEYGKDGAPLDNAAARISSTVSIQPWPGRPDGADFAGAPA